jgi:nitronate monooxygenase
VGATCTNVKEADMIEAAGADFIICQGIEAGGHQGSFTQPSSTVHSSLNLTKMVSASRNNRDIPIICAGGIMEGRDIYLALANGACAVQMGTAFLTLKESGINSAYKNCLLESSRETRLTTAFSGRYARGLNNEFMDKMKHFENTSCILPFPLQNTLTLNLSTPACVGG